MAPKQKLVFAGSVIVIAMLACQGSINPIPSLTAEPTRPVETVPTYQPPIFTTITAPGAAGTTESISLPDFLADPNTACAIHQGDRALSCLSKDGWRIYTSDIPTMIAQCLDGRIYLSTGDRLYLYKNKTFVGEVKSDVYMNYIQSLACGPQDEFWATGSGYIQHYDGSTWTNYWAIEYLGYAGYDLHEEIAIAPNGNPWVITNENIGMFNGKDWQVFEKGKGFEEKIHPLDLVVDANGNAWGLSQGCQQVANCHVDNFNYPDSNNFLPGRLLKYDGNSWTMIPFPDRFYADFIRLDRKGRIWIGGSDSSTPVFYIYDPQSNTWALQFTDKEFGKRSRYDMQIDRQDRLWLATNYGLDVYDGSAWITYRMDNADLYANNTDKIIVLGDGPQLPAPSPKASGSVSGKLVDPNSKTSFANLQVEICLRSVVAFLAGNTPCANQAYHALTKMDAEGNFLLKDIPAGRYYLMIQKSSDTWAQMVVTSSFPSSLGAEFEVNPGAETQLGEIMVSPDKK